MECLVSFEPQIAWLCPHMVKSVPVDLQGTTGGLAYPVSGALTVEIDGVNIPSGGLKLPAKLWSSQREPYARTVVETLTVLADSDTLTFSFPARSLSAQEVVRILQSSAKVNAFVDGSRFYLESRKTGAESLLVCSGTAASSLGLSTQLSARGVTQYPAWSLGKDSVGDSRILTFQEALIADLPVTASYRAIPSWCPRCQGTLVENDLRINQQGAIQTVEGSDLLYQRCLKVVLTRLGSNPYVPRYGTNLLDLIGRKNVLGLQQAVTEEVRNALTLLQSVDRQQAKIQQMSLAERLGEIVQVRALTNPEDPTLVQVEIEVRSMSRQPVQLSVVFSVSGATSTQGTQVL